MGTEAFQIQCIDFPLQSYSLQACKLTLELIRTHYDSFLIAEYILLVLSFSEAVVSYNQQQSHDAPACRAQTNRTDLQGACWGRSRVGHRGNLLPVAESLLLGLLGNRRLEEGNRRPEVGILLRGGTLRAEGGSIHPGVDRLLVGVGIHPGPADTGRRREGNFHPQEGIQGNSSLTPAHMQEHEVRSHQSSAATRM